MCLCSLETLPISGVLELRTAAHRLEWAKGAVRRHFYKVAHAHRHSSPTANKVCLVDYVYVHALLCAHSCVQSSSLIHVYGWQYTALGHLRPEIVSLCSMGKCNHVNVY